MPSFSFPLGMAVLLSLALVASPCLAEDADEPSAGEPRQSHLTGEILPVFYVADVRSSVELYRTLGFTFRHYWDYDAGAPVTEWTGEEPPTYAEMSAGPLIFGIHLEDEEGGARSKTRHYFRVDDVAAHRRRLAERGVEVGELHDLPWMLMFSVRDPDGHLLSFFTPPAEGADDDASEP